MIQRNLYDESSYFFKAIDIYGVITYGKCGMSFQMIKPCRVGSVGSVSASRMVGREFASRPGHTKDHHKNSTNCLPA